MLSFVLFGASQHPDLVGFVVEYWAVIVLVLSSLAAAYRMMRASLKNMLHEMVVEEIRPIQEQFKNNGGSTLKDAVDRMETLLDEMAAKQ